MAGAAAAAWPVAGQANDYGRSLGFPTGWGPPGRNPNPWGYPDWIVGNFSGGVEALFDHRVVKAPAAASALASQPRPMKWGLTGTFQDYQKKFGKPAMLVARADTVYYENYEFDRTAQMRFYSKSMAKSVLSLLVGLAFDNGVFGSLEDPIHNYDDRFKGKPLGEVTLRQALNMSSGADLCHWLCSPRTDFERWNEHAFMGHPRSRGKNTDQDAVTLNWAHGLKSPPGKAFNYSHVDPHLIGMALRAASKMTITEYTQTALWHPMGAQADAVWLTDAKGVEEVSASFSATLRDWGRLALLVAQGGALAGKQIIKASWFQECRTHRPAESFLRKGRIAGYDQGYKFYFHHPNDDGSWLRFGGDLGQSIYTDAKSGTALVILSASNDGGQEYRRLFETAIATTAAA
jgi:CubicO group peptidase (beta-lactamase class C family)